MNVSSLKVQHGYIDWFVPKKKGCIDWMYQGARNGPSNSKECGGG